MRERGERVELQTQQHGFMTILLSHWRLIIERTSCAIVSKASKVEREAMIGILT